MHRIFRISAAKLLIFHYMTKPCGHFFQFAVKKRAVHQKATPTPNDSLLVPMKSSSSDFIDQRYWYVRRTAK